MSRKREGPAVRTTKRCGPPRGLERVASSCTHWGHGPQAARLTRHVCSNLQTALALRCGPYVALLLIAAIAHGGAMDFRSSDQKDDPFAQDVRKTPALTPEQEQKTFHLPPGFEIELVTSEPDILKPTNMQFDERGRLWVSTTHEYPFPAPEGKGRDAIKVIEIGRDGHATKVTTFKDNLNIPIGIYPYKGGAIAYSIPKIRMWWDEDGDGVADQWQILYGDIGTTDTHGMTSAFRRGYDGFLYAAHGFKNKSHLVARDGTTLDLDSGNTYRMTLDGTHLEQFTWGQTNPFGLTFDPLGNLYSADSHSKPVMLLLRGGYYMGIGKADDGLGFAPLMMEHMHGSTAIAGVVHYDARLFPKEYWGTFFNGNVITSRINHDTATYVGSSPNAHEEKDFLTTDDPWFRPVDTQIGPDGALYVADFYNRIIGHYEVPLGHPGRDRERGRIWRITYHGAPAELGPDWGKASLDALLDGLNSETLMVRMIVMNQITDRFGAGANDAVRAMLNREDASTSQKVHGMWLLARQHALDESILTAAATDPNEILRVHAMRILSEKHPWAATDHGLAMKALSDSDALVRRCAADALGTHPATENVRALLDLVETTDPKDIQLMYEARMSLRNQLRGPDPLNLRGSDQIRGSEIRGSGPLIGGLSVKDIRAIADVSMSINTPEAAKFVVDHAAALGDDREVLAKYLRHALKYAEGYEIESAAAFVRRQFAEDDFTQLELFKTLLDTAQERKIALGDATREWAARLVTTILRERVTAVDGWVMSPVEGAAPSMSPWTLQPRNSSDGDRKSMFLSSLPAGEPLTGVLRSPEFIVPSELKFFFAGHDGWPSSPPQKKNYVRLIDAASRAVLAEAKPPRKDLAQPVTWKLQSHAGAKAYLELTDGDTGTGYAWLAVGRFSPAVVPFPKSSPSASGQRMQTAAELAGAMKLTETRGELRTLASDRQATQDARVAAANTLVSLAGDDVAATLAPLINNPAEPVALREKFVAALADSQNDGARAALAGAIAAAPNRIQTAIAKSLAKSRAGGEALLATIDRGKAPARLLQDESLRQSMLAAGVPDLDARIKQLTRGMPSAQAQIDQLLDQRRLTFRRSSPNAERGKKIFMTNCTVCHQIDGQGKLVGPQLDGIGNRGPDRLIEDVLDPNRNVDPAFRFSTITLKDGRIITALQKRADGDTLTFVDTTGKEFTVQKSDITERLESKASLMISNFSEIIPPNDFNDLIAFLLKHKAQKL
jgi:putative heme-binding domain-containing protein